MSNRQLCLRDYLRAHPTSFASRCARLIWQIVWLLLFRPSPVFAHGWRRCLLRMFGAKVGTAAHPYPSARIWAPWNLVIGDNSCLASNVDCYCVDVVSIGKGVAVSQYSFLCTGSHNYNDPAFPLITGPIFIGDKAWIAAGAFVGPNVRIGDGAVVAARASLVRDVESWTVVAGNPARVIGRRNQY